MSWFLKDIWVFDRQRKERRAFLVRWMEMCQDAELRKDRDCLEDCGKFCGRCWACLSRFHSPPLSCSTLYYPWSCFCGLWCPDICMRLGSPVKDLARNHRPEGRQSAEHFSQTLLSVAACLAVAMSPGQLLPGNSGPGPPLHPRIP